MDSKLNMMLVGTPGAGKTYTSCGLIPGIDENTEDFKEICPLLYLDTEKGANLMLKKLKKNTEYYEYMCIDSIDKLDKAYHYVNNNKGKFKTIVIDSIQSLQRQGLNKFAGGKESSPNFIKNPLHKRPQDYGNNLYQMEAIYKEFFKLDVNLITTLIAGLEEKTDMSGNIVEPAFWKLALPSGQQKIIPSLPDIVALIEIDARGKRTIITEQKKKYPFVKDRVFPEVTNKAQLTTTLIKSLINKISKL
jgi:hypothetical protein